MQIGTGREKLARVSKGGLDADLDRRFLGKRRWNVTGSKSRTTRNTLCMRMYVYEYMPRRWNVKAGVPIHSRVSCLARPMLCVAKDSKLARVRFYTLLNKDTIDPLHKTYKGLLDYCLVLC